MQTELLKPVASGLANSDRIQRLVADFLAGRKATTLRTYSQGLADFAQFTLGASGVDRDTSANGADAQKKAAADVQQRAIEIGTAINLGIFFVPVGYRDNVKGMIPSPVQFFWNMEKVSA